MPSLDEGSILDMPVSVPRASVTEAADDIKARDALLRQFPEVESVVGKAGRADTPTDPAPLEMIETFVNLRPRELWPKRAMKFSDAVLQARVVLAALEERGYVQRAPHADDRDALVNEVAMNALTRFDEDMRERALHGYQAFERELRPVLTRFAVADTVRRLKRAGDLQWAAGADENAEIDKLAAEMTPEYGRWLARNPALEDVTKLTGKVAQRLAGEGALKEEPAQALVLKEPLPVHALNRTAEALGADRKTFAGEVLAALKERRLALWRERVHRVNWELFDRGVEALNWAALEEYAKSAKSRGLLGGADHGTEFTRFGDEAAKARAGRTADEATLQPFIALRRQLDRPFADRLYLWPRKTGSKSDLPKEMDLVKEMDTVLQVPGWSNIWTQPIANRIDMLATGVRTQIGVKVFGPDLETVDRVSRDVEAAIKTVPGSQYVVAEPIMGKGYLEIRIDRQKAARYGINVNDIQDTIEVALGGRVITQTVEGRERFPVRVRYARDFREDEEKVKRLLVSRGGGMSGAPARPSSASSMLAPAEDLHETAPEHSKDGPAPLQIPLSEVADVRVIEGPSMIKSENGLLRNYVMLSTDRDDVVGFVDEARRVVDERVRLPEGAHLEWSGEFEHQVRAARTNLFVFPAVIALIFVILYLTYKDLADAALMMLAVPEALAGGAFLQFLFPKIAAWDWHAPPLEFSQAVWVGYIACFGMATETGIIMLVYLREAIAKRGGLENIRSLAELRQAVIEGAVHRLRPKLLTEGVAIIAIAPMLYMSGVGAEVIFPMAVPVLGGLLISDEVVDIFLPVRFYWVRRARWLKLQEEREAAADQRRDAVTQPS
jgi:Cu(I)/Ag(I) efflux system membrane protein CusA/SilA